MLLVPSRSKHTSSTSTLSPSIDRDPIGSKLTDLSMHHQHHPHHQSTQVVEIHPNFRIIALASPPSASSSPSSNAWWLTEEVSALFAFHTLRINQATVLYTLFNNQSFIPSLLQYEHAFRLLSSTTTSVSTATSRSSIPALSLRRTLRIAKQLLYDSKGLSLERVIYQQLLLDMLSHSDQEILPSQLREVIQSENNNELMLLQQRRMSYVAPESVPVPTAHAQTTGSTHNDHEYMELTEDTLRVGSITIPRYQLQNNPELIPNVSFTPVHDHLLFMERIMEVAFRGGEKHVLVIGSQGVGKNRIIESLLQMLRGERYYMQLHRDSTVSSLSVTPELEDGLIVWKDSLLVRAAIEGKWIILDEVDKAPLEVVILLKALFADGILPLSDGRKLGSKKTPIHPNFRSFVLANRPGFPFLGNDFFRSCGDVFSCFILDNPSISSELSLLQSVAPRVSLPILRRLTHLFSDLRSLSTEGILSYPYSTRELLHVVRHGNMFGRIDEALKSIFAFDSWNRTALKYIKRTLEIHEFPVASIISDDDGSNDDDHASSSRDGNGDDDYILQSVTIQTPSPIAPPTVVATRTRHHPHHHPVAPNHIASFSAWMNAVSSDTIPLPPPIQSEYKSFDYIRTREFSEIVLSLQLDLSKGSTVTSIASSSRPMLLVPSQTHDEYTSNHLVDDELCVTTTTDQHNSLCIHQINISNWQCKRWVLEINSRRPTMKYRGILAKASEPSTVINGAVVSMSDVRSVYDCHKRCHVWIPLHHALISLPTSGSSSSGSRSSISSSIGEGTADNEAEIVRFNDQFKQHGIAEGSVQLVGCCDEGSIIFIALSSGEVIQMLSSTHRFDDSFSDYSSRGSSSSSSRSNSSSSSSSRSSGSSSRVSQQSKNITFKLRVLKPSTISSSIISVVIDGCKVGVVYESNPYATLWIDVSRRREDDGDGDDDGTVVSMATVDPIRVNGRPVMSALQLQPSTQSGDDVMQSIDSSNSYALLLVDKDDDDNGDGVDKTRQQEVMHYTRDESVLPFNVSLCGHESHLTSVETTTDASLLSSRWVMNCRSHELELIDIIDAGDGLSATRRVVPITHAVTRSGQNSVEIGEPVAAVVLPTSKGLVTPTRVAIAYKDGTTYVIEPSMTGLKSSLEQYKELRGGSSISIRSDPRHHKHASGDPKHGKEDDEEHHGGNTWAGGTGGADTAGLGGAGGPYRLDKGFNVHQVDQAVKDRVPKEVNELARKIAKEALEKKLQEMDMDATDWKRYSLMKSRVIDEIESMKLVLSSMSSQNSSSSERVWKSSSDGEIDGDRLVDALAGERMIFKKRVKRELKIGEKNNHPKRISILLDISASMYRFDGVDGRLQRMSEVALMLMEAFHQSSIAQQQQSASDGTTEQTYLYELRGHTGDDASIVLVNWNEPPKTDKDRYAVIQSMQAYAQYCDSGDTTLEAVRCAVDSILEQGSSSSSGEDRLVLAFSDANLDRYGITSKQLTESVVYRKADKVSTYLFFIASFGDQARKLVDGIPPGHAAVITELHRLPFIIKEFMIANLKR